MAFRNKVQLLYEHTDDTFRRNFSDLFALRRFLTRSLPSKDYVPAEGFEAYISETATGAQVLEWIAATVPDIPLAVQKLALFHVFAHDVLLIDTVASDITQIEALLSEDTRSGRLRFPWVYERTLYDKFNRLFSNNTQSLTSEETETLIEGTPQGVFQTGTAIVGPFGILRTPQSRDLDPVLTAPLWHCSDFACRSLHPVQLTAPDSALLRIVKIIREHLFATRGPRSEWNGYFDSVIMPSSEWYDHLRTNELPWLLANAFVEDELKLLLTALLTENPKVPRSALPKHCQVGAAAAIVSSLSLAQVFQLVLLASDGDIVSTLELLIESGQIHIPATELRTTTFSAATSGWFGIKAQCSQLGVRLFSDDEGFGVRHLKNVVEKVYSGETEAANLAWKLRHVGGHVDERLSAYLYERDLEGIVTELFLDTPGHLDRLFKQLRFGAFSIPTSTTEEARLIRKLLWKIGFGSYLFPGENERFWSRLNGLEALARAAAETGEDAKEKVRSAGVNLFVSLEEILDASLSFITWALLSDHFGKTKFRYNLEEARTFMAVQLNTVAAQAGITFDAKGKNTLYPLISGFNVLADICAVYLSRPDSDFLRASGEFPGFSKSELQPFVFRHRVFLFDGNRTDIDNMCALLRNITRCLSRADVAYIRNRIDHQRADFPSPTEVLEMCSRLSTIVQEMETAGVIPLLYVRHSQEIDGAGRGAMRFVTYNDRKYSLRWPQIVGQQMPGPNQPITIIPGLRLRGNCESLRFRIQEPSQFVKRWDGYPVRRKRVSAQQQEGPTDLEKEQVVCAIDATQASVVKTAGVLQQDVSTVRGT